MEISAATLEDIPDLCELLEFLFAQETEFEPNRALQTAGLKLIIEEPERGIILVLRDGNFSVGMVNLLFTISTALGGRVAIIEDLIVHPTQRNGGAGSQLLAAAIETARDCGCRRITLLTDCDNHAARRFYERSGFSASHMIPLRLNLFES